jgi:hypothetical protein
MTPFEEGQAAYDSGYSWEANPYPSDSNEWTEWDDGWRYGQEFDEAE